MKIIAYSDSAVKPQLNNNRRCKYFLPLVIMKRERTDFMRVWDIHPGYLSRQSLLGQHVETHALYSVISGGKRGYAAHPETLRWKERLGALKRAHDLAVAEMHLRGFNHASPLSACGEPETGLNIAGSTEEKNYVDHPVRQVALLKQKYLQREQSGRIPLPKNSYDYWAHHKYSVMARGYNYYKEVQGLLKEQTKCSPGYSQQLFELILNILEQPVTGPALANTVDHLWGYFKEDASASEKERYLQRGPHDLHNLVRFFYALAEKQRRFYLLHSTIFADFTDLPGGTGPESSFGRTPEHERA